MLNSELVYPQDREDHTQFSGAFFRVRPPASAWEMNTISLKLSTEMVILREVLSRPKNSNSDPTQNTAQSQNYKEN